MAWLWLALAVMWIDLIRGGVSGSGVHALEIVEITKIPA